MTINDRAKSAVAFAVFLGLEAKDLQTFALEVVALCLFKEKEKSQAEHVCEDDPSEPAGHLVETKRKRVTPVKEEKKKEKNQERPPQSSAQKSGNLRLLCRAGAVCVCDVCKAEVYRVNADIHDGLSGLMFASRFTPIGKAPQMPIPIRISAIDGCVMTDCPLCKAELGLILWGRKPERALDETSVGSVGSPSL